MILYKVSRRCSRPIFVSIAGLWMVYFVVTKFVGKSVLRSSNFIGQSFESADTDSSKSSSEVLRRLHLRNKSFAERKSTRNVESIRSLSRDSTCLLPGLIQDGIPWPECLSKFQWMKQTVERDNCFRELRIFSNDSCSILKFLSVNENHCPPQGKIIIPPLHLGGVPAIPRSNFQHLYNELQHNTDYSWIKHRIFTMENLWLKSAERLFDGKSAIRKKKRIHIHLGLMALGLGKTAGSGGPLGELVQWSDLIASLYVMGHDIVITSKAIEVQHIYGDYKAFCSKSPCAQKYSDAETTIPYDIIYTDINGYRVLLSNIGRVAFTSLRCRIRVVDSFGTEALFNHPPYSKANGIASAQYNGLDLKLQQFNTMFPHTPDNTFLGFVTEFPVANDSASIQCNDSLRNVALVYGKLEKFWDGKERYLDIIKEYVDEVHATVGNPQKLPSFVINHGIVDRETLANLLQRTKIFVGLGFPFEGPAPLEAIQRGAVFLNPKFPDAISSINHPFYKNKPTRRRITSQNPYAEFNIGEPMVYTVDINDEKELRRVLQEIKNYKNHSRYLAYEFSTFGMLERLSIQIEKQQFCVEIPYSYPHSKHIENMRWPPIGTLLTSKSNTVQSCNEVCASSGLVCEPSFFPVLNRMEGFQRHGVNLPCNETVLPLKQDTDYPAFDSKTGKCYLQTNPKLFSCAGNNNKFQRICPCRDYVPGQVALCRDCGIK